MKTTSTLLEIIVGELGQNPCENDFFKNNQITFFSVDDSFITRLLKYEEPVIKDLCDWLIFGWFKFDEIIDEENPENNTNINDYFKKMFITRFIDREIKFQTIDLFRHKCVYKMMSMKDYIELVLTDLKIFALNTKKYKAKSKDGSLDKNRNVFQDQPQNQINLDLTNDVFNFATNNGAGNSDHNGWKREKNVTEEYDPAKLKEIMNIIENIFKEFDRYLFLQIG